MGGTHWNEETSTYVFGSGAARMLYYLMFRLLLCSAWFGTILAVGIAFVSLSNKEQRRTRLFQLQCICVILTILYNASEAGNVMYRLKVITFKSDQNANYIGWSIWRSFGHFGEHAIPTFSDSALLFRISSFFPFPIYSKKARFFILSPFWFLIICRFILAILVIPFILVQWFSGIEINPMDSIPYHDEPLWSDTAYDAIVLLELSMGSLFCMAASTILLFKAYQIAQCRIAMNNKAKINARMRFFAEALLMCCIPPIFCNIAAPIQLMKTTPTYSYFREIGTLLVNVTVVFSILATSWSSIRDDWSNKNTNVSNLTENTLPVLKKIKNTQDSFQDEKK